MYVVCNMNHFLIHILFVFSVSRCLYQPVNIFMSSLMAALGILTWDCMGINRETVVQLGSLLVIHGKLKIACQPA